MEDMIRSAHRTRKERGLPGTAKGALSIQKAAYLPREHLSALCFAVEGLPVRTAASPVGIVLNCALVSLVKEGRAPTVSKQKTKKKIKTNVQKTNKVR
jgi:hypothetical protein